MNCMNGVDSEAASEEAIRFLVLLFGTFEYDGRVQRMVEVLKGLGTVTLVDLAAQEALCREVFDGLERFSVAIPPRSTQPAKHLRFACAALRVALNLQPDVVVAEDYFTTGAGWLVAKLVGATLIYDAHELIIPEPMKRLSLRGIVWYQLERFAARRAALVVTANPQRAQIMAQHYEFLEDPEYMRNIPSVSSPCPSVEEITRLYPALVRSRPQERIILYQGYVSLDRGLGRFVEALTYLPQQYRFAIVGDGPDLERIKEVAKEMGHYGRLDCLGRVPSSILPAIGAFADVGIVTYPYEGLNNIYCAPNKIFEYAEAGVPVVATDQPPLRELVERYSIGALIRQDDSPETVAQVLRQVGDSKACFQRQLEHFLIQNRWEDEATRVRDRIENVLREVGHDF